jgi:hypothetical protein
VVRGLLIVVTVFVACGCSIALAPAWGHGPCDCLTPASGPAGTAVSAAAGAYKVVFNPDRTDLAIGPKALWRDHRPDVAPIVVFRTTYRYSDLPLGAPVDFRVPKVSPGRYLVSIYDGSEGGAHYTWEYFRVTEGRADAPATRAPASSPASTAEGAGISSLATVLVGVSCLLVGLFLGLFVLRRWRRLAS